jgi:hypothetical protein
MANGHHLDYAARGLEDNPWSRVKPRPRQRPDPCEEPCTPRCPACGGLQCLCRPRFFPGQLLTDQDLNRLQQYVIDKNRLHNRYLHGWGVACGLEVVCDVCDSGHVIVRTGYALSPCGDDIIVCNPQSVDICALINACEPREPLCEGPYDTPPRDCTGGKREWVLAICYDERPVRGVTAQLGAGDTPGHGKCACGGSGACGCGGGSGAGCGCGGKGGGGAKSHDCSCGGHETKTNGRKPYKPQCEPTQICEGYKFVAYPKPDDKRLAIPDDQRVAGKDFIWAWLYANRSRFGPLIERVLCCVTRAMELRDNIREGKAVDLDFAKSAYTEYASALAEFAADFAIHRCAFVGRTTDLRDKAMKYDLDVAHYNNDNAKIAELGNRVEELDITWLEIVSECLCSALLPACPKPANSNCVPLAVVTISDGDCRVVEICNWSERKLLISWPTVTYWLSWLPWHLLSKWVAGMCCGPRRGREAYSLLMLMLGMVFSGAKQSAAMPMMMRMETAPGAGAPGADPLKTAFAADNLLVHMLGEFDNLRTKGAEATGQPAWAGLAARFSDASALSPRAVDDPKLATLLGRLESAETKLRHLDKVTAELKKKGRK